MARPRQGGTLTIVAPDRIELLAEEEMALYSEFRILSGALDRLFEFSKIGDLLRALDEAGVNTRGLGAYASPLAARAWIQARMAVVHRQLWGSVLRRAHTLARQLGRQLEMEGMNISLPMGPVGFEFQLKLTEPRRP